MVTQERLLQGARNLKAKGYSPAQVDSWLKTNGSSLDEMKAYASSVKNQQSTSTPDRKTFGDYFMDNLADIGYGAKKALSGATFGASDWALRKLGLDNEQEYLARKEAEGLGTLTKGLGLGSEIGGNVIGASGVLLKGLGKAGLKGLPLALTSGGIEGGAYGATSSDTLQELPENVLTGVVGGTIGGALGEGTGRLLSKGLRGARAFFSKNPDKTSGAALGGLVDDVAENIGNRPQAERLVNEALEKAQASGRSLIEVADDSIVDIAQKARQKTPEARYILSNKLNQAREAQPIELRNYINDILGTSSRGESVREVTRLAQEKARPIYDRLNAMGDLAEYEIRSNPKKMEAVNNILEQIKKVDIDKKANREAWEKAEGKILNDRTVEADINSPEFMEWSNKRNVVLPEQAKSYNFMTGEPVTVKGFHGSPQKNIDMFKNIKDNTRTKSEGIGHFFTDRGDVAQTYGENIYPTYLNMEKPLVVDYNGKFYYEPIKVNNKYMGKNTGYAATSVPSITDVARYARDEGYDGVVVKNIIDSADTMKLGNVPNLERIKELKKYSLEELFQLEKDMNHPYTTESLDDAIKRFKGMGGKRGLKENLVNLIEQTERMSGDSRKKFMSTDYIVFNPEQIKSVYNSGRFAKGGNIYDDIPLRDSLDNDYSKLVEQGNILNNQLSEYYKLSNLVKNNNLIKDTIRQVKNSRSAIKDLPDTDFMVIDNARSKLSAMTKSPDTTVSFDARQALGELDPVLGDIIPEYAQARRAYMEAHKFDEAGKLGETIFNNKIKPIDFNYSISKFSPAERDALAIGIGDEILAKVGSTQNPATGVSKLMTQNVQDKMRYALGDDVANSIVNKAEEAVKVNQNYNKLLQGSQTSEKQGLRDYQNMVMNVLRNPAGILGELVNPFSKAMQNRANKRLANALTSNDIGALRNGLNYYNTLRNAYNINPIYGISTGAHLGKYLAEEF